jgi:hypothetical protein
MSSFGINSEPGEMLRIPLDSVILMLKEMLSGETVTSALLDCLEPPEVSTIGRSFESLYSSHFITKPDDSCEITALGKFVSALGIDLALGSLVGLGIQFGVGAEAIEMAAILSFPKTPWIISNAMIHETKDFNGMFETVSWHLSLAFLSPFCPAAKVSETYVSRCHFDANLFSEPLASMNLLWEFEGAREKMKFCTRFGVFLPRIQRLRTTKENLRRRVGNFLGIPDDLIAVTDPPMRMAHSKVLVLRIIQAWVFRDSVIECHPESFSVGASDSTFSVDLEKGSGTIEEGHLYQFLNKDRHPFDLKRYCEVQQNGSFDLAEGKQFLFSSFEERLISFAVDKGILLAWCTGDEYSAFYVNRELFQASDFALIKGTVEENFSDMDSVFMVPHAGNSRRGVAERPCGRWNMKSHANPSETETNWKRWRMFNSQRKKSKSKKWKSLMAEVASWVKSSSRSALSVSLPGTTAESRKSNFCLRSYGSLTPVSMNDMRDMFEAVTVKNVTEKQWTDPQQVVFHLTDNMPLVGAIGRETSWDRALIGANIPEGARILTVLASERRKTHFIRMNSSNGAVGEEEHVDVVLNTAHTSLGRRWKRLSTRNPVYVESNSVPATAVPLRWKGELYCLCANTLDVRGGGVRVEGLTLLPSGRLFVLLCRLTFGLNDLSKQFLTSAEPGDSSDWDRRIGLASSFNDASVDLGEKLECFPSRVQQLLNVFDEVDGHKTAVWDSLFSDPFLGERIRSHKARRDTRLRSIHTNCDGKGAGTRLADIANRAANVEGNSESLREAKSSILASSLISTESKEMRALAKATNKKERKASEATAAQLPKRPEHALVGVIEGSDRENDGELSNEMRREAELILAATSHIIVDSSEGRNNFRKKKKKAKKNLQAEPDLVGALRRKTEFSTDECNNARSLFATALSNSLEFKICDLPSSNILAIVIKMSYESSAKTATPITIDGDAWTVFEVLVGESIYYHATFKIKGIRYTKQESDKKRGWITRKPVQARPTTLLDAFDCVPKEVKHCLAGKVFVVSIDGTAMVVFEALQLAVQMEAAFWLERQFRTARQHWYQQTIESMVQRLSLKH